MAAIIIRIIGYIYISIKKLSVGLYYARRNKSIYYIYINRVFNVAKISRLKKTRESSKNRY